MILVRCDIGASAQVFCASKDGGHLKVLHCVSSSLIGTVDPSFRALSRRLKFTVRFHKFKTDFISVVALFQSSWAEPFGGFRAEAEPVKQLDIDVVDATVNAYLKASTLNPQPFTANRKLKP